MDAPNGVEKLRQMVLSLAVRGKLVEQSLNDESVTDLLRRIQEKKESWIEEGRLKKSSMKQADSEIEEPWTIPDSWNWVRFSDVTINRDAERIPLSREARSTREGPYDYYGASGVIDHIDDFIFDKPLLLIGEDGANLINRSTPIAFIAKGEYWVNNHAHVLDSVSLSVLRYLEVFINAIDLKPYVTGTAQPKMNQAKMNSIAVAFPPLAEQKRIVAKVDELMALCDELDARQQARRTVHVSLNEAALDRLTTAKNDDDFAAAWNRVHNNFDTLYSIPKNVTALRQTILQLAVMGKLVKQDPNDEPAAQCISHAKGHLQKLIAKKVIRKPKALPDINTEEKEYSIPDSWDWVRLNDVCELITDGTHQTPKYTESGRMFLSAQNVKPFRFQPENHRFVSETDYQNYVSKKKASLGDVLLTVGAGIGEAAVVDQELDFAIYVSLGLIRPIKGVVDSEFLVLWLNSPIGRKHSSDNTYGKGVSQGNLNLSLIRSFLISLPPRQEQQRIVSRVNELMSLCDELETRLTQQQTDANRLTEAMIAGVLEGAG